MDFQVSTAVKSAFTWLMANFRALVLVSIIPAGLLVLIAVLQTWLQIERYQDLLAGGKTTIAPFPASGEIIQNLIIGIIIFLISVWLSVKVTRLRLLGAGALGPASPDELTCTYRSLLYQLAFIGLLIAAYLLGLLAFLAAGYVFGGLNPAILFAAGISAIIGFAYALVRFSVAFPAIAVGLKPHIIKDMWPFAREYTWTLMGWMILIAISITLVFLLLSYTLMFGSFSAMQQSPRAYLEYLETNAVRVIAANVIFSLLNIPVYWFFMLFFAESFEKIAAKKGIWRA